MAFVPEVLTRPALCLQDRPRTALHRSLTAHHAEKSPYLGGRRGTLRPSAARNLQMPVHGSRVVSWALRALNNFHFILKVPDLSYKAI